MGKYITITKRNIVFLIFALFLILGLSCEKNDLNSDVSFETLKVKGNTSFEYLLYKPRASLSDKFPLIISFHGFGEAESLQETKIISTIANADNQLVRPCYIMAPMIKNDEYLSIDDRYIIYQEIKNEVVRLEETLSINIKKIYVIGNSFGGLASIEFFESYPDIVSGAIVMCPALSYNEDSIKNLDKLKNIPIWFAHATNDNTIPVSISRSAVEILNKLGAKEVHITEFTNEDMRRAGVLYGYHQVDIAVMGNDKYMRWLFEK